MHRHIARAIISPILIYRYDARDVAATSVKVSDFGLTVNGYTSTHKYVEMPRHHRRGAVVVLGFA